MNIKKRIFEMLIEIICRVSEYLIGGGIFFIFRLFEIFYLILIYKIFVFRLGLCILKC